MYDICNCSFWADAGTAAFLDGGAQMSLASALVAGDTQSRSVWRHDPWRGVWGGPGASIAAVGGLPAEGGSDGQRLVDGMR